MTHDRPTHAETIRPALVELPLWLVWRLVDLVNRVCDYFATAVTAYEDSTPVQRRLLGAVVVAVCALFTLGVLLSQALT